MLCPSRHLILLRMALTARRVGPPQRPRGAPDVIAQRAQAEAYPRPLPPQVHQQPALPPPRELAWRPRRLLLRPPGKAARLGRRHRDTVEHQDIGQPMMVGSVG